MATKITVNYLPGNRLTVNKSSSGSLHDFKQQIFAFHSVSTNGNVIITIIIKPSLASHLNLTTVIINIVIVVIVVVVVFIIVIVVVIIIIVIMQSLLQIKGDGVKKKMKGMTQSSENSERSESNESNCINEGNGALINNPASGIIKASYFQLQDHVLGNLHSEPPHARDEDFRDGHSLHGSMTQDIQLYRFYSPSSIPSFSFIDLHFHV